jgi:hypothetical protein
MMCGDLISGEFIVVVSWVSKWCPASLDGYDGK